MKFPQLAVPQKEAMIAMAAVLSTLSGAGVGYRHAMKRLEGKYADLASAEIEQAKEYYARTYKADEYATPESAVAVLIPEDDEPNIVTPENVTEALNTYQGKAVSYDKVDAGNAPSEIPETVVNITNVFVEGQPIDPDFDWEAEQANRDREQPYIINHLEFDELTEDYTPVTLTYFEEDGVLADAADEMIEDVNFTVGENNVARFGHGSRDANVVYIRNERLDQIFEVLRSKSSFSKDVLGISPQLEHSDRRPLRRMRSGDDG